MFGPQHARARARAQALDGVEADQAVYCNAVACVDTKPRAKHFVAMKAGYVDALPFVNNVTLRSSMFHRVSLCSTLFYNRLKLIMYAISLPFGVFALQCSHSLSRAQTHTIPGTPSR